MKNLEKFKGFRKDCDDLFRWITSTSQSAKQSSPFLVIAKGGVSTCHYWGELVKNKEITSSDVIIQTWPGQYRSDIFCFELGAFKTYLKENKIKIY